MNLLIFNLKTDADDHVLGFTTDWINAMARNYHRVFVITMYAGRIAVGPNVTVYSVGKEKGYSEVRRAFEFYKCLFSLLGREKVGACFAHMMPLFAVMGWPLLALRRIPIVLWYAHKATPPILRLASLLVNRIVTSNAAGFGVKSGKVLVVGHGITEEKFPDQAKEARNGAFTVIAIGRITAIKHLKELAGAVGEIAMRRGMDSIRLILLGDVLTKEDQAYKDGLIGELSFRGLAEVVHFHGAVPHSQVADWLKRSDLSVNLCPTGAMDKAVIESMATRTPTLTRNLAFLEIFQNCGVDHGPFKASLERTELCKSIESWMEQGTASRDRDVLLLSKYVLERYGLKGLTSRVCREIESLSKREKRESTASSDRETGRVR